MNIQNNRCSRIGALLVGLIVLGGCAAQATPAPTVTPAPPPTSTPGGAVELVIWGDPAQTGQNDYRDYVIQQFEAENPGVTIIIEEQGWDEALRQNILNALLAGTPPDIIVGENYFQFFAEMGELYPLDDALGDAKANLIPATYRAAEFDGRLYGVPAFTGVFGFERNCAVVEAAGLDCENAPQTWDELLREARTITEQGAGSYYGYTLQGPGGTSVGSVFRIAVYLAQAGASLCKDNCTYPYFNDPKAAPVMEFLREINGYTPPGLTFNTHEGLVYHALYEGLSAYQIAGSWHPGWARDSNCVDCRYSSVPIPADGQPASIVVGNVIYAVMAQSAHPDIAAKWVTFLARDDVQNLVYPSLGRLPATRSSLETLRPNADSATQPFIDELLTNEGLGILPQWERDPKTLWTIYNEMLTEILTTERPVQAIMDEAQARADEVFAS